MWYIELATTCYCRLWASWLLPSVGEGSFCCNTKVVHSSWDQWGFGLGRLTYPSRALLHPVMRRLWTRSGNSNVCPPLQASIYNSSFFLLANSLKSALLLLIMIIFAVPISVCMCELQPAGPHQSGCLRRLLKVPRLPKSAPGTFFRPEGAKADSMSCHLKMVLSVWAPSTH